MSDLYSSSMKSIRSVIPGILLITLLTTVALGVSLIHEVSNLSLGPLTLGLGLGLVVTHLRPLRPRELSGVRWMARTGLRIGIVLMGFRLTLPALLSLGAPLVLVVLLGSVLTFGFTLVLGRILGVPGPRALFVAAGTSICGAAAIAAVQAARPGEDQEVALALGAVTLFGTLDLAVYPMMGTLLGLTPHQTAVWTGASVHEVAQVAAIAALLPTAAQGLATTVKLLRVLLIVPLTLGLSFTSGNSQGRVTIPWFALGFFAIVLVFSFPLIGAETRALVLQVDQALLTGAMAALGLELHVSRFRGMGWRELALTLSPTLFLALLTLGFTFALPGV